VIPGNIVIGNSCILFVRHNEFERFEIPPHLLKPHSTATHFLHNLLVLLFGIWLIENMVLLIHESGRGKTIAAPLTIKEEKGI